MKLYQFIKFMMASEPTNLIHSFQISTQIHQKANLKKQNTRFVKIKQNPFLTTNVPVNRTQSKLKQKQKHSKWPNYSRTIFICSFCKLLLICVSTWTIIFLPNWNSYYLHGVKIHSFFVNPKKDPCIDLHVIVVDIKLVKYLLDFFHVLKVHYWFQRVWFGGWVWFRAWVRSRDCHFWSSAKGSNRLFVFFFFGSSQASKRDICFKEKQDKRDLCFFLG